MHSLPALGALDVLGSAIPFVPTGELVSGSAALSTPDLPPLVAIFVVSLVCSMLGDTALLLEARLGRRRIQSWLDRRPLGQNVRSAQNKIDQNATTAIITGRLIPGGRAPVILAIGLSQTTLRRFLAADIIACSLWAAIYTSIGALGGSIAGNPFCGLALGVTAALALSALLQLGRKFITLTDARTLTTHGNKKPLYMSGRQQLPATSMCPARGFGL